MDKYSNNTIKIFPIVDNNINFVKKISGIKMSIPYVESDLDLYTIIRSFGGKWNKNERAYTVKGDTWPFLVDVIKYYVKNNKKFNLHINPYLDILIDFQLKKLKDDYNDAFKIDSNLVIPVPEPLHVYPHQAAVVEVFNKRKHQLILADEMGTGKTISAICIINYNNYNKVLIVCPDSIKKNWQYELNKWIINKNLKISIIKSNKADFDGNIIIINYDLLKKYFINLKRTQFDFLIADEAHQLKSTSSVRFQMLKHISTNIPAKLLMTGTPILNRPVEIYALISILGKVDFGNKEAFVYRYCNAKVQYINKRKILDVSGSSNEHELMFKLYSTTMMRRTQDQVFSQLINVTRHVIPINLKAAESDNIKFLNAKKEYESQLKTLKKMFKCREIDYNDYIKNIRETRDIYINTVATLRRQLGMEKIQHVIKFIEEKLTTEKKIVVFGYHREFLEGIYEHFKECSTLLYGGMTNDEKQYVVDLFNNNENINVFVSSIVVGGFGLTLTSAHTIVFGELDWVPSNISQCEYRCIRIGQEYPVNVYYIVAAGYSLDHNMLKKIASKVKIISKIV